VAPAIGFIVSVSLAFSPQVLAQEESDDEAVDEEEAPEEIVVTGSRLKRDTYSSISPLQIITGQVSREVGLINAADILQESTAASGQQIDLTFQGFVLDNGPGATTIDLRGLGSARTLVLVNGRRLSPAGVEGAPVSPDLNLVPASLVQQYDLLLDGASSVYGSDAVAGVANIILRKDFDGFEIEAYSRVPHHDNGLDNTLSAVWGHNFDRGFIGVGAEYVDRERVRVRDRPWTAGCSRDVEVTESGEIRSDNLFEPTIYGMEWDDGCGVGLLAGRVSVPAAGSIYYTPGYQQSAGGWPEFSESSLFGAIGVDGNGDGSTDVSFKDYDLIRGNSFQDSDLLPSVTTQSFMAFGEYTFSGEANITPYFEVLYARRDFKSNSAEGQLFPVLPANNPFNICNPAGVRGVDCGEAWDALMNNPNFVQQVLDTFGCDPSTDGSCDQTFGGPIGPQATIPIVSIRGDRNLTDVMADQTRGVLGVRGDMPFMSFGSLDNWTFDLAASYSMSTGESTRPGVRADRLDAAMGIYSLTDTPCELNVGNRTGLTLDELQPDATAGCVPVDLFAPSLYPIGSGTLTGDFATQAERDFLFDNRDFDTEYEQTIVTAYATGDIFEVPAGPVAFGIGAEYRKDEINSLPDVVAREGLFWGFFSDGGAVGSVDITELFAEVEVPIFAGTPGFQELNLNLSSRMTDHEIYGENWTWSGKLGWRPTDALLLRATYGTTFRAPNLRELYLQSQSGFPGVFDPCLIPEAALDPITGDYIPGNDTREQEVLANCLAQGVDPTVAQNNGFNTYSVESARGGSLTLDPEKSDSWSAGLSWDQPFTNAFGLSLGATYYEIDIRNTIISPSAQFIVNDCYGSLTGNSAFCDRITRRATDPDNPDTPFLSLIDSGFINRDAQTARGLDINLAFDKTFTVFNRPVDFSMDIIANRQYENSALFIDDEGNPDFDNFTGEWGYPEWQTQGFFRFDYSDFRFTWETRYLSSVDQDPRGIDDFSDIFEGFSETCLGPPDDEQCRDVAFTSNYFQHNMSVYYYGDRWTFGGGIRNVFDEKPPFIDESEPVTTFNNTPIGYGYDINGRVYFFNVAVTFGGSQ
jgi:iron complex outermembrane receptor protein